MPICVVVCFGGRFSCSKLFSLMVFAAGLVVLYTPEILWHYEQLFVTKNFHGHVVDFCLKNV